jgi:hypothetical protein
MLTRTDLVPKKQDRMCTCATNQETAKTVTCRQAHRSSAEKAAKLTSTISFSQAATDICLCHRNVSGLN